MGGLETAIAALLAGTVGFKVGVESSSLELSPPEVLISETLRTQKPELIKTVSIDTSVARDTVEYTITGSQIFLENPKDSSVEVYIRLNEPENSPQDITKYRKITGPFYRFFVTNEVGSGILNFTIGRSKQYDFEPGQVEIHITGSEVMLPVDIQAQYVNLSVDIVAQTIGNIAIDIAAQSVGNISMNIAAQSLESLSVDITAQTIGNLSIDLAAQSIGNVTIDIYAQSIGINLQPGWAAEQGTDKDFDATTANVATGSYVAASYTVPAGKALFITCISGKSFGSAAADRDKDQMCELRMEIDGTPVVYIGGNGGAIATFSKPYKVAAGEEMELFTYNRANHNCDLSVAGNGYEVTV